jgi:hypothetical protein
MTLDEAVTAGFLNLSEEDSNHMLDSLFDTDDAQQRLNDGVRLLLTFLPEEKLPYVLDLAAIVLDADEELADADENSAAADDE